MAVMDWTTAPSNKIVSYCKMEWFSLAEKHFMYYNMYNMNNKYLCRGMKRAKLSYCNLGIPLIQLFTSLTDSKKCTWNCNIQPLVHGGSMTLSPPADICGEHLLLWALLNLVWDLHKTKIDCIKDIYPEIALFI